MSKDSGATLPDAAARERALEIDISCIVQAPAGSGKTELLTLRYLKLLTVSKQPEEVLAITFTRKAASEMRDRILSTLSWALEIQGSDEPITEDFLKQRLAIANSVLEHDKACNWNLLKNPSRLRVQTIDSFCFYLANQLPVLSRVGGNPVLSEDVDHIYAHAIANTLKKLESEEEIGSDIEMLLQHLDNNLGKAEKLLSDLLNRRDQWVSHILLIKDSNLDAQAYLKGNLAELVEESLEYLAFQLEPFSAKLATLARFAGQNRRHEGAHWQSLESLVELPDTTAEGLPLWQMIVELLLTQKGEWRSQVTVRQGFPPGDSKDKEFKNLCVERKKQFKELIAQLKEIPNLLEALNYVRKLPDASAETKQWGFLSALTRILIHMSGELLLSFSQFGMMDYAQTGSAAKDALGDETHPTDIALSLDHRIQHILVDEFQDTSQLQLEILQQLTAGWTPDDQRSLFLVGDAMQSCYGFRNANVGIYLNAREHGIGEIRLESLNLRTNFRSQKNIVSWVNEVFSTAFPAQANSSRGAVPYSPSTPLHKANAEFGITTKVFQHTREDKQAAQYIEASEVIEHIKALRQRQTDASIAILVRSRSHLAGIIPLLRQENIPWLATDIDRLGTLPVVEDLLSLTRAILNPADRVAWLAILRAPWCGLTSKDLLAVTNSAGANSIWSIIKHSHCKDLLQISDLSADGAKRLTNLARVLDQAMAIRYRVSLRYVIESTWTLLRGFATTESTADYTSISHFLTLLEHYEYGNGLLNLSEFEERVSQSFVSPPKTPDTDNPVNILTMHKAKGLEFDHVILPGLTRTPASDDKPLLQWFERLNAAGDNRLFITAQSAIGQDDGKLYELMRYEQQQKNRLEDTRLLYIAVTRARTSALLLGTIAENAKGDATPPGSSLLNRIWPELSSGRFQLTISQLSEKQKLDFYDSVGGHKEDIREQYPALTPLSRFHTPATLNDRELELLSETLAKCSTQESANPEIEPKQVLDSTVDSTFDTAKSAAIGTLIHSSLESFSKSRNKNVWIENLDKQLKYWRLALRQHIDNESELENTLISIKGTVKDNVSNRDNAWIFDNEENGAASELSLTNEFNRKYIVDRTLIDSNGTRWIIDFKTGSPNSTQTEESFIETMVDRYQEQLENYGQLLSSMEERPIKLALYLTHLQKLVTL